MFLHWSRNLNLVLGIFDQVYSRCCSCPSIAVTSGDLFERKYAVDHLWGNGFGRTPLSLCNFARNESKFIFFSFEFLVFQWTDFEPKMVCAWKMSTMKYDNSWANQICQIWSMITVGQIIWQGRPRDCFDGRACHQATVNSLLSPPFPK